MAISRSVLAIFLHDLICPGKQDGGAEEGHVDKDLPLDVFGVLIRDVDERCACLATRLRDFATNRHEYCGLAESQSA